MTTLKNIFEKPVDRPIEGVIKADDEASLRIEIEEYVLTKEVANRLDSFLGAYNDYENANGVWISGFFGSGKSHLLKILALLLENREIEGKSTLDLLLSKCGDDEILRANLRRAANIPSKSILFNIDQKADVISKTQTDALLAVFVKVFDEMCGYYGKQGHIAQFERDLDSRGLYKEFKNAYRSVAPQGWERGREQALLESENIAKAYACVTGKDEASAKGILTKYRDEYRVSIEDFAERVHAYIEQEVPSFRLNFFVDEAGQYIAENIKLMTNLQTIAESLATKCRGRAWIIVTAQEDMEMVVGEMGKQLGHDFSKIQARFPNRMKLTSADVEEVIQKRLLQKSAEGTRLLLDIYSVQYNNFKTLFDFADGSLPYSNFRDQDHFIDSYPFVPYQFSLFQAAIQSLSLHNAFEGKHSSVGERSMLGVFQQVATQINNHEIGQLATFDLMFEGIRTALKSNIQRAIIRAEGNLEHPGGDCFETRLLKTLFLVKYVKEFKPTPRNLSVLMLGAFNQSLHELRKRVVAALNRLEQQTYVQRNGEFYEYLTDEEQDVEKKIKNTDVDPSDVAEELQKIIFDHAIKQRKIRYDKNGQDYPFSRKLDDRLYGREHELTIHIVSPFHESAGSKERESVLLTHSMSRDELLVWMPPDERLVLVRNIHMYMKTEKYIRQNTLIAQHEAINRILSHKGRLNQVRYTELQQLVLELMKDAKLFVVGNGIEISSEDAQTRVQRGFQQLVERTYRNLRMLPDKIYSEDGIARCLEQTQQELSGTTLPEPEHELLAFIQSNKQSGIRTTLKRLLEKFERKPYGWYYAAILCTLAKLCARGKVEASTDSNFLEGDKLERTLRNSRAHDNVVLVPQIEFTASQIRGLKEFHGDFFDESPRANEAKALGNETIRRFQELTVVLIRLAERVSQYPFSGALEQNLKQLKKYSDKPYAWYLTGLVPLKDSLLEMKEAVIDPIRDFMDGEQKKIFDDACQFVQTNEPNFRYIDGDEALQVNNALKDPECFKGNRMQQLKTQAEALQMKVIGKISIEKTKAKRIIDALQERLCAMAEFSDLNSEQQELIVQPFDELGRAIEQEKLIAVIRDAVRCFEGDNYQQQLSQLATWSETPVADDATVRSEGSPMPQAETKAEYVPSYSVQVPFDKAWLADESDVEHYLKSMREALLKEIRKGKKIQI